MSIVLYFFDSTSDLRGSLREHPRRVKFHRRERSPISGGSLEIATLPLKWRTERFDNCAREIGISLMLLLLRSNIDRLGKRIFEAVEALFFPICPEDPGEGEDDKEVIS